MPSHLPRRHLLTLVGSCLFSFAGCVSSETTSSTREPTAGQTTTGTTQVETSSVSSDCPLPRTESVTTHSNPPTSSGTGQLPGGLAVDSNYDEPLSVVLTESESATTTFVRTYPPGRGFDVGDEMKDWLDYDVVLRSGCDVLWERTIGDYAALEITVEADGAVEIDSLVEA